MKAVFHFRDGTTKIGLVPVSRDIMGQDYFLDKIRKANSRGEDVLLDFQRVIDRDGVQTVEYREFDGYLH